jgi:predicted DNA-binding transcriptional regulator AlpA
MSGSRQHRTANSSPDTNEVWTPDRVRSLGVATDLRTAASIFGMSTSAAYGMINRGAFPVPVIRAGGIYRVPVAAILTALQIEPGDSTTTSQDGSPSPGASP